MYEVSYQMSERRSVLGSCRGTITRELRRSIRLIIRDIEAYSVCCKLDLCHHQDGAVVLLLDWVWNLKLLAFLVVQHQSGRHRNSLWLDELLVHEPEILSKLLDVRFQVKVNSTVQLVYLNKPQEGNREVQRLPPVYFKSVVYRFSIQLNLDLVFAFRVGRY